MTNGRRARFGDAEFRLPTVPATLVTRRALHGLVEAGATTSPTGRQWIVVLALSLILPAAVGIDKAIQLRRQRTPGATAAPEVNVELAA